MRSTTKTAMGLWGALIAGTMGCKEYSPAGLYAGTITESASVVRAAGAGPAHETVTMRPHPEVTLRVEPVAQRRVRVHLGSLCTVLFEQSASPNEHSAQVVSQPPQRCDVRVDGYEGRVTVVGTANFARETNTLTQVQLSGTVHEGGLDASWNVAFTGQPVGR